MRPQMERVAALLPAYDLGGELGRGAWGVVFGGTHRQLNRPVAIKQLPPAFSADADVRARFVSEARLLASLDHPHIVPVYDFVEAEGLCLLIMERLDGGTVHSRMVNQGLDHRAGAAAVLAASAALHFAHGRGVLHRDVKPENLMFSADGILKVTDFGIAKLVSAARTHATATGMILGTPAYMAPEQALGRTLGPFTDVYAIGSVLYEIWSGALPFPEGSDPITAMYQHAHEDPRPLSQVAPDVPGNLRKVVMRALARDPERRFQTAEAFGTALATAANEAWGAGWVGGTGIQVRSVGAIPLATAPIPVTRPGSPAGPPPAAGPRPAGPTQQAAPARAAVLTPPPTMAPAGAPSSTMAAAALGGSPGVDGPAVDGRRKPLLIGAAAAVVVVLLAVVALAMGDGGGGDTELSSGSTTSTSTDGDTSTTSVSDPTATTLTSGEPTAPGVTSTSATAATGVGATATTRAVTAATAAPTTSTTVNPFGYSMSTASGAPGVSVTFASTRPCPALPAGWTDGRAGINVGDDVGYQAAALAADGNWSGAVVMSDSATRGTYPVRIRCEALDPVSGGYQGFTDYDGHYKNSTFTVV